MKKNLEMPSTDALAGQLEAAYHKRDYRDAIRSTLYTLIIVAAGALLVATLILPVIRVYGSAMSPTIKDNSVIICKKNADPEYGDVMAFYYNNKILIRRVIAMAGDEVTIESSGVVLVNGEAINETYIDDLGSYIGDITYPYIVPEDCYFVLQDNREGQADSRSILFGCIQKEDMLGRVILCVWPFNRAKLI